MTSQQPPTTPPTSSRTAVVVIIAVIIILLVVAVVAVAVRNDDNDVVTAPPSSTTTTTTTVRTTTTTTPGTSSTASTSPGGTSTTSSTSSPATTAVQLRPNGLGVTSFGDDMDASIATLTAKLGAPTDAGTVAPGQCSSRPQRTVRWHDLQVGYSKPDTSDHLVFDGYIYGTPDQTGGPATAATPALTTPGGFGVTGTSAPIDQLLAQARADFPKVEVHDTADATVKNFDSIDGTLKLNAVVHQVTDGWRVRFIEVVTLTGTQC